MQVLHPTEEKAAKHGIIARILHWSTGFLLLFAFIENGDVTNALRDPAAMRMEAYLGIFIVGVFGLRLWWMHKFNNGATRLPDTAPRWEHRLARPAHLSLYVSVLAMVLTGLSIPAAQAWGGPSWVDAASGLHEFVTSLSIFLILAHLAAALWHKIMRRDGVWESMSTPWWGRIDLWIERIRRQVFDA